MNFIPSALRSLPEQPAWRQRIVAAAAGLGLLLSSLVSLPPASASDTTIPGTIPSIANWKNTGGAAFQIGNATKIATDTSNASLNNTAEIMAAELGALLGRTVSTTSSAGTGDIDLRVDTTRNKDLGQEGYQLTIGDKITVTGATQAGAFYGSRTVLQMLMQQKTLPAGTTIDVPKYKDRGVTLCACVINISPGWIDRLLEEMSFLKLNQLLIEMKVKVDKYPLTNTWSYYTKADIKQLVQKAAKLNIDVIPEINSPGHMEIWLENMPDLQLTNPTTGAKDEVRMDITKDASFTFYTDLINEYSEVFTSKYWHMGADEYMLGSGYANYPQIKKFATQHWGPNATENDVVAWYVNKVNAFVKSKGKQLRIWNDGIMANNTQVKFDTDITVEHWNQAGSAIKPQQLLDWGHKLTNNSTALYMVRGSYGVDTRGLYNNNWNVGSFYEQQVDPTNPGIIGAKFSMWPDGGTPQEAENTTQDRMFEALRFTAQSTWTAARPWANYDGFKATMDTIGRPPLWKNSEATPVAAGTYTLAANGQQLTNTSGTAALGSTTTALKLVPTADRYYTLTDSTGKCLDISRNGTIRLGVPVQIGANIVFSNCDNTTMQKWQLIRESNGFQLVNAASQQYLSVSKGLTNIAVSKQTQLSSVPDGKIVQTPKDRGATVWSLTGQGGANAALITPTSVTSVSSQQATGEPAGNGPAAAAIDGNNATYWHSQWAPTTTQPPHAIVVDLGKSFNVSGLAVTPRNSSGTGGANGRIANYQVFTSDTLLAWNDPAWGTQPAASSTWTNTAAVQTASFSARQARYVKLVALSEVNNNPWATIAELQVAQAN